MTNNVNIKAAVTTATIATIGATVLITGDANADELTNIQTGPSVSQDSTTRSESDKQTQYAAAQKDSADKLAELPTAEYAAQVEAEKQDLVGKQNTVNEAQTVVDSDQNKVDAAQTELDNAQDVTNNAQLDVDSSQSKVDEDTTSLNSANQTVSNIQDDINNQPEAIDSATNSVSNAQDQVTDAQEAVKYSQATVSNAQDTLNEDASALNNAQKDVNNAQKTVSNAESTTNDALATLDHAKGLQENANKVIDEDNNAIGTATANLQNESNKLNSIEPTIPYFPIATPSENDGKQAEGNTIQTESQLPVTLTKPANVKSTENNASYYGWYDYKNSQNLDTSSKISTSGMTNAQQQELANYALTLINNFREQNGLGPIHITNESQQGALQEMVERLAKGTSIIHNHFQSGTYFTENSYGGVLSSQNLGMNRVLPKTMLQAKTQVLNQLTAMAYQDGSSSWMHRDNLLSKDSEYGASNKMMFGAYFTPAGDYIYDFYSFNPSQQSKLTSNIDATVINNNPGYIANPAYTDQQAIVKQANQELTKVQQTLAKDKLAIANIQANIDSSQKAYDQASSDLSSAKEILASATNTLSVAQQKVDVDNANLQEAKSNLLSAQQNLDKAENTLTAAQDKLAFVSDTSRLQSALVEAKNAAEEAQKKLDTDKDSLTQSETNLSNAKANLKAIQVKFDLATTQLVNDKDILQKSQNELSDSQNAVLSARSNAQAVIDAETNKENSKLEKLYNDLFHHASNIDIPAMSNVSATSTDSNSSTPDAKYQLDNSQNKNMSSSEKTVIPLSGKKIYSVSTEAASILPSTGFSSDTSLSLIGLLFAGFASVSGLAAGKKKKLH